MKEGNLVLLKEILLHKRVREILERKPLAINIDTIQPDTPFADLGLDLLDMVNLLFEVENLFNVEIQDGCARKMDSIADIMGYIENNTHQQA